MTAAPNELNPEQAAPVPREYARRARIAPPFLHASPAPPLEACAGEAATGHPVSRLHRAGT